MPFFGVPIRNGLPIGLGSVAGFGVQQFDPSQLFEGGTVAGAWYDPSDLSTMFDTSAGTTPVAMPGQGAAVPVGLMLDKSQGLVLGPELVTNGDFDTDSDWTKGTGWTIAGGVATHAAGTASSLDQANVTTPGKWYKFTVEATASGGTWALQLAGGATTTVGGSLTTGNFSFIALAAASNTTLRVFAGAGTTLTIDNISVRELPGNHAIAANDSTKRPVLMARVNLLTYSEEFDNGAWSKPSASATISANQAIAPNGTNTADLIYPSGTVTFSWIYQAVGVANIQYTLTCYAKDNGKQWFWLGFDNNTARMAWFDVANGVVGTKGAAIATSSITSVGNGWYKCEVVYTHTSAPTPAVGVSDADASGAATASGTSGIYIWGADLRPANIGANVPAYQRIADANTYNTSGFPLYLRFDGIDDSMYTPANLNLSGTDKVAVFAGVRKNADVSIVAELSANASSNNGAFLLATGGWATENGTYVRSSRGTATSFAQPATNSYPSPQTNVLTGTSDIAGDSVVLRINGTQVATSATDQGSGNYGTYPLFIGSRNNSSLRFNGHLHSLIIAGSAVSAGNISATEQWVAGRTGISIP